MDTPGFSLMLNSITMRWVAYCHTCSNPEDAGPFEDPHPPVDHVCQPMTTETLDALLEAGGDLHM